VSSPCTVVRRPQHRAILGPTLGTWSTSSPQRPRRSRGRKALPAGEHPTAPCQFRRAPVTPSNEEQVRLYAGILLTCCECSAAPFGRTRPIFAAATAHGRPGCSRASMARHARGKMRFARWPSGRSAGRGAGLVLLVNELTSVGRRSRRSLRRPQGRHPSPSHADDASCRARAPLGARGHLCRTWGPCSATTGNDDGTGRRSDPA
jgi:hypothetical protein